jgi:hypothetical protein
MTEWMETLKEHYERVRKERTEDLIILFDIDGTILDLRYSILGILKSFDRVHETDYFALLTADDVGAEENDVEALLRSCDVPDSDKYRVLSWYMTRRWSSYNSIHSPFPVRGVFELIHWFQAQSRTFVGLNTSRSESLRSETLRLLNRVGEEFKVGFPSELLRMNYSEWPLHSPSSKVSGVRYYQNSGYRVVAMVDNELENLEAIAESFPNQGLLLVHANRVDDSTVTSSSVPSRRAHNFQNTSHNSGYISAKLWRKEGDGTSRIGQKVSRKHC